MKETSSGRTSPSTVGINSFVLKAGLDSAAAIIFSAGIVRKTSSDAFLFSPTSTSANIRPIFSSDGA